MKPFHSKKYICISLLRMSLEPSPLMLITAIGYELYPGFDGQAYDHKLSIAERYPVLS
jgi:hypothetical protein